MHKCSRFGGRCRAHRCPRRHGGNAVEPVIDRCRYRCRSRACRNSVPRSAIEKRRETRPGYRMIGSRMMNRDGRDASGWRFGCHCLSSFTFSAPLLLGVRRAGGFLAVSCVVRSTKTRNVWRVGGARTAHRETDHRRRNWSKFVLYSAPAIFHFNTGRRHASSQAVI